MLNAYTGRLSLQTPIKSRSSPREDKRFLPYKPEPNVVLVTVERQVKKSLDFYNTTKNRQRLFSTCGVTPLVQRVKKPRDL